MKTKEPILVLKDIVKKYGKTVALNHANLRIFPGEVHALMGANGAGKSTIIGIISGAIVKNEGKIILRGNEVEFKNTMDSKHHGIACVYQELSLMPHLTVTENLMMNHEDVSSNGLFNWNKAHAYAEEVLKKLGASGEDIEPDALVSDLRADQQQLVEIARAINQGADILLLDEPTSSLNFEATNKLFELIRTLCSQNIGIIFVSHRMKEIRQICDRITVFKDGCTVVDGVLLSEKTDEDIVRDMVGRDVKTGRPEETNVDLSNNPPVLEISFSNNEKHCIVHEGEIVGIAGLTGSGRSALLRTIWGDNMNPHIELKYLGKNWDPMSPKHSLKNDIAYIGEDRALTGLFLDLAATETIMMPNRIYENATLVSDKENETVNKIIDMLKVKIVSGSSTPRELSGGNQQKLLFGKWFVNTQKLFLLDEPTRGVDIHTKQGIYSLIRNLSEQGSAALVVSSEITELVELCHKVIILKNGVIDSILSSSQINEDYIMSCITDALLVKEEES